MSPPAPTLLYLERNYIANAIRLHVELKTWSDNPQPIQLEAYGSSNINRRLTLCHVSLVVVALNLCFGIQFLVLEADSHLENYHSLWRNTMDIMLPGPFHHKLVNRVLQLMFVH